ncbi:hypothetical protein TorRG33x02_019230, partial [Trema orientale]
IWPSNHLKVVGDDEIRLYSPAVTKTEVGCQKFRRKTSLVAENLEDQLSATGARNSTKPMGLSSSESPLLHGCCVGLAAVVCCNFGLQLKLAFLETFVDFSLRR